MNRTLLAALILAVLAVGAVAERKIIRPDPSRNRRKELRDYREWTKVAEGKEEDYYDILYVPTGFAASMMCSGLFLDNMSEEEVLEYDVDIAGIVSEIEIDYDEKSVTTRMLNSGENELKSIYREGVGCTIVFPVITEEELRAQYLGDMSPLPPLNETEEWPLGNWVDPTAPEGVDMETLQAVVDADFANERTNTRAIIVVYKGKIVLEQYKPGMGRQNRFLGWSMTKSVNAALVGIMTGEGRLAVDERIPVPEWEDESDPRHNITVGNMLNMASGLNWLEGLNIPQGLYMQNGDCAGYAAGRSLRDPINSVFEYSTGTSTILARTVHQVRANNGLTDFEFPRAALFSKIGMNTAVIEPHLDGYHLGGSNMHASALDWARFGLLNMRYGEWVDGNRILPEGWVEYSCTPSDAYGGYGAQWWVGNSPEAGTCRMSGFRGQSVHTMKTKDLMVVRLSMPKFVFTGAHESGDFIRGIYDCFP